MRSIIGQSKLCRFFSITIFILILLPELLAISYSQPSQAEPSVEITLVFTGDIMTGRSVGKQINENNDNYFPFRSIGEYTKKSDITFGNLETTVSERGEPLDKLYTFRAKPETLQGVKDAGFDVLTIANNHICDFGPEATQDTMKNIEDYGMKHVGLWYLNEPAGNAAIPRPVVIETKGVRFAFLGYAENPTSSFFATVTKPGPVPYQYSIMKADIEYANTIADIVVVSIHWARLPQYVKEADVGQVEMCRQLCDWGADILANHGPHVLQEVEFYNESLIFYSLGNTVFDLSNEDSHYSAIAILRMKGTSFTDLELVPIIKNEYNQYIARGNILTEDIGPGLYLNWTDYSSRMYNSDEVLTEYSGPNNGDPEHLLSDQIKVVLLISALVIIIIILILIQNRKKVKK